MKKNVRLISIISMLCMLFVLTSCGERADKQYVGKWVSVAGEAMGVTLTGDDINGFALELKDGGKATMTLDGEEHGIKWKNDDTTLTINVDGTDVVGTLGQDTIVFDNMLGQGLKLTFAKEGSEAAKAENNLPENEKNMIGLWKSVSVADVLGDPVKGVSGEALTMEFAPDHSVAVTYEGKNLDPQKWSMLDNFGYLEGDDSGINWDVKDGYIEVTYTRDGNYYVFKCTK